MGIVFDKFSSFSKGTMYELLNDAYSFDENMAREWESNWKEADEFFYNNLHIADACGFVTAVDGKPIGFICWDPRNVPEHVEIGHNCIASEYKGQRFGQLQLQEAVNCIAKLDAKKIIVTTNEYLVPAQRNYMSVGFTLVQKRENDQNPDVAGMAMDYEKIL